MSKVILPVQSKTAQDRPEGDDFFIPTSLKLKDGRVLEGLAPRWQTGDYMGEVVFNTGMTGYIESLTDPSYSGQILVFTYPLIGNYGVLDKSIWESEKIHARGVVVSEACQRWSHSQGLNSLLEWLQVQGVPIIMGVDTRALTKHLRRQGTMMGLIGNGEAAQLQLQTLKVSIEQPTIINPQYETEVIVVDCGIKSGIINSLAKFPVRIKRVPHNYDYSEENFAGVLLSNGPGDPTDYPETVAIARKAMEQRKPMFGICLGSQIMGLAAGARTYKLLFGHRGHNQPCMGPEERCVITSQNHGYAIDASSLPSDWKVLFHNLNDGSVEGIEHQEQPFFSVQFHPEANPGPTDTSWLFKRFFASL